MRHFRLFAARLMATALLLLVGGGMQSAVAQDDGPAEGYYFINSASHPTDAIVYNNTGTFQA